MNSNGERCDYPAWIIPEARMRWNATQRQTDAIRQKLIRNRSRIHRLDQLHIQRRQLRGAVRRAFAVHEQGTVEGVEHDGFEVELRLSNSRGEYFGRTLCSILGVVHFREPLKVWLSLLRSQIRSNVGC